MKTLYGIITSLRATQTARVKVTRSWQHPVYKKYVKRSKNYSCHYENMELQLGDEVLIQETRPISKTKRFKIIKKTDKKVKEA